MKAFKRVRVYDQQNQPNLKFATNKIGVYIIFENRKRVYIGNSTSNLYKTITRHFQEWNDKRSPERISYKSKLKRNQYSVLVIFTTEKQAESLEKSLILKYNPRDNFQKYELFQPEPYDRVVEKTFERALGDLVDVPF